MKHEFVSYQIALDMKSIGFDEPCFGYYENGEFVFWHDSKQEKELLLNCSAPTFSSAFRWFREKYNLHQVILADEKGKYDIIVGERISGSCLGQYSTYEEAELECLKKLIEIVKNK